MSKKDSHNTDENLKIILNALDTVYPLLSQEDKEQIKLYTELRSNPYSKNSQKKTIKLLLRVLIKSRCNGDEELLNNLDDSSYSESANSPVVKRLLSHLESHVVLLEAISHNPELASLFLVGSSGSQSFSSLQKSVLMEQASRTRYFISHFKTSKLQNCDSISNYKKNLISPSSLTDLSEKIEELNSIKNSIENERENITKVKNAFKEVCSLLETSVLFNDILIQKYNDNEISKQNEKLEKQITEIRSKKNTIQAQLNKLKHHIGKQDGCLDNENQLCRQKIAQLENEKCVLLRQIESNNANHNRQDTNACEMKTLKTENRQLASQIDLLNKQVSNYQTMISQKDDKINSLKSKIEECSQKVNKMSQMSKKHRSEVEEIHKLYQNASNQLNSISDQLNDTQLKNTKLQKVNSKLTKENSDLKSLLERANETNQNHLKDNQILIKQMRQNESNKDSQKEEKLKEVIRCLQKKLNEALKFISRLQEEIKQYKDQHMNQCNEIYSNSNSNSNSNSYEKTKKDKKKIEYLIKSEEEEESTTAADSSSSSISLINKNKNKNKINFKVIEEEEEEEFSRNSKKVVNNNNVNFNIEIEEEEEDEDEHQSAHNNRYYASSRKKVLNVDDNIVIKTSNYTKNSTTYDDNSVDESYNTKVHVGSSIMPSFDEIERDIKKLEVSVIKTRNLVSQSLNE